MPKTPDGPILLDERYTVGAALGEGSMGRVYKGQHTILRKDVAIKVLHRHLAADDRSRKRMLREARLASAIRHPNVVEIIDFGETPRGSVYLVMELVEGRQLGTVVADHGALAWPRAHGILSQIASALSVAHEHGIVHRDIKPGNCIVSTQVREDDGAEVEVVKLLDFGIAKVDEESASMGGLTGTGEILGTASYMAPELTLGSAAGVGTDMYSLGCMAYELLTGAPPFAGDSAFDVLRCHLEDEPVPPRKTVPDIPPALEAVVLRMLAKKPEGRYASMSDLEAALQAIALPSAGADATAGPGVGGGQAGPSGTEIFSGVGGPSPAGEPGGTEVVDVERMGGPPRPAPYAGAPSPAVPAASSGGAARPGPKPRPTPASPPGRPPTSGLNLAVIIVVALAVVAVVGVGLWIVMR